MKNETSIEDIKQKYGSVITNAAVYNILQFGMQNFKKSFLSDQTKLIEKIYRDLDENKEVPFAFTKEFTLRVLTCQNALLELKDQMELMAYFSRNKKREEE